MSSVTNDKLMQICESKKKLTSIYSKSGGLYHYHILYYVPLVRHQLKNLESVRLYNFIAKSKR